MDRAYTKDRREKILETAIPKPKRIRDTLPNP